MQTKCTSCGASNSSEESNCNYCGSAISIDNNTINDRIEKLNSNGNLFKLAETAFQGEDYDEAIKYYNKCLEIDADFFEAWYKKGASILMTSTLGELKAKQAIAAFNQSIQNSPNEELFKKRIKKDLVQLLSVYYSQSYDHFVKFKDLPNSGAEFSAQLSKSNDIMDYLIHQIGLEIGDVKILYKTLTSLGLADIMMAYLFKKGGADKVNNDLSLASEKIGQLIDQLKDQWKKLEPETLPQIKKSKGCFIATAVMGDYNHPVVKDLRLFRDNWLLQRAWGVKFTQWYYTHGPKAARVIEKSFLLKRLTYFFIVKPLQMITKKLR
jgi:tetratricopeptide (TPR) repeat protein